MTILSVIFTFSFREASATIFESGSSASDSLNGSMHCLVDLIVDFFCNSLSVRIGFRGCDSGSTKVLLHLSNLVSSS